MKLNQLIKNLQEIKKEVGNVDVVYSIDDEGNDFRPVYYEPTLGRLVDNEFKSTNFIKGSKIPKDLACCIN